MSVETGLGLREAARDAYATAQAEMAAREAENLRIERIRTEEQIARLLEVHLGVSCRPELDPELHATIDGLVFALSGSHHLCLVSECRRCGRPVSSGPIYGLPDLGRLLVDREWQQCWQASECHEPIFQAARERVWRGKAVEQQLMGSLEAFLDSWLTERMIADEGE